MKNGDMSACLPAGRDVPPITKEVWDAQRKDKEVSARQGIWIYF